MNKKYHIKTFGCQMNVSDSERIASFLESKNFIATEKIPDADLVVFNTCGIKQTAENRAYSLINNLRKSQLKANSYKLKAIIMTGCLANRIDVQKRMKGKVDLFCEIKNFQKEFEKLSQYHWDFFSESETKPEILKKNPNGTLLELNEKDYLSIAPKYTNNFQAYVPIMTGCNNFCSYCVVPYARGPEVSRPADEIITEVKGLIAKGYKSITLLGQNVNSYNGKIRNPKIEIRNKTEIQNSKSKTPQKDFYMDFPTLLKKLDQLPGKFWLSFVSSHPKDMSDKLIETVAQCKKVCEWIHLPVQAGNDKILEKMNRHYTQVHYLKLIKKIKSEFKKHKPSAPFAISSDMIMGFPGETKLQFADSVLIMEKAKFDMVFFGQFSPRPGTIAWKMKDNVSQAEKVRRENLLNDILAKTTFTNNKKYVGKTLEVLIESKKNDHTKSGAPGQEVTTYFGKTRTQKNVKIISARLDSRKQLASIRQDNSSSQSETLVDARRDKKNLIGTFAKVKIIKANTWNLEGEIK